MDSDGWPGPEFRRRSLSGSPTPWITGYDAAAEEQNEDGTLPTEVCPSGSLAGAGEGGFERTQRRFLDWLRKHM